MLVLTTPEDVFMLSILYRDDWLIAIDKPPGLLVHRSPIDKHETQFAVQMLRDQVGQYVYPIHRLDRPTSGVLLFTFTPEVASQMGHQVMNKQLVKHYQALVRGDVHQSGVIDYPLAFRADKYGDKERLHLPEPQNAVTSYQGLRRYELPFASGRYTTTRVSLISLFPVTGRKHQLRRHMAHFRHPIVGDTTHGDGKRNKMFRQAFNFCNLALTCTAMGFYHPVTNKWVYISAPVHEAMETLLDTIQIYQCN